MRLLLVILLVVLASARSVAQGGRSSVLIEQATIRGRCVDGATGEPVVGCDVKFGGWVFKLEAGPQEVKRMSPLSVVTGDDGRFEIRFTPPESHRHWLEVHHEGYYPRTTMWGAFEPGQVDDLGDISLHVGYAVRGKVVNTLGEVVSGASVRFDKLCLPIERDPASCPANALPDEAGDIRSARSKKDGTFVTQDAIPAGTWPVELSYRRGTLVEPREVTIPVGGLTEPMKVVVKEEALQGDSPAMRP